MPQRSAFPDGLALIRVGLKAMAGNRPQAHHGPRDDAAADAWIANWGTSLAGKPQTIQDYAKALASTPGHQYNPSPKYPGELAARYKQLVSATADCGTTF